MRRFFPTPPPPRARLATRLHATAHHRPALTVLALALATLAGTAEAVAQQPPLLPGRREARPPSPYEGMMIREVRIVTPAPPGQTQPDTPLDPATETLARNQIRSTPGTPYTGEVITEDIRKLNRLGRFGQVRTYAQPMEDGTVILTYVVTIQPIVEDVQVVGNTRISDQKIREATDVLVGAPVDDFEIARVARLIQAQYRQRGFYLAQVTADREELAETGILYFRVRESERLRVTDIRFEGNKAFSPRELRTAIRTRTVGLLERAPLDDATLDEDVASLIAYYRDRGYIDARVDRQVTYAPNGREAIVTFHVDEGRLFTMRHVRVVHVGMPDDHRGVFTSEQIAGLIGIKSGDVYSARKLRQATEEIRKAYGMQGYVLALPTIAEREGQRPLVRLTELRDETEPFVDLVIQLNEGQRFRTGEIVIHGNTRTRYTVIQRQVMVKPDRPLDVTAIDESRRRIQRLRLFSTLPGEEVKITVQDPDPALPTHRDVLVEVKEASTGEFNIGGQVNSDRGVSAMLSYTQRNFDITDTPESFGELFTGTAFRGAGQTLSLDARPGDRFSQYAISFSEPFLLDTNNSLSTTVFYADSRLREYDEERYGGRLGVGRTFGDRWRGNLRLRGEWIQLSDLDPGSPTDFFALEERKMLTGLGLTVARSSADDPYVPTRGNKIEFGVEQVGLLGGDFDFTKLNAEYAVYIPLYEDFLGRATVLSFSTRASYIPQGSDQAPVYERYYLGGSSFRGFRFRTISPRGVRNDTGGPSDDPVGGSWLFFFGSEIRQPLVRDIVSGVAFIDTGTVTDEPGFDNYRVSVGVGLRIKVDILSPIPLAFDFGFPIVKEDTDRGRLFTFSIDVPFGR